MKVRTRIAPRIFQSIVELKGNAHGNARVWFVHLAVVAVADGDVGRLFPES